MKTLSFGYSAFMPLRDKAEEIKRPLFFSCNLPSYVKIEAGEQLLIDIGSERVLCEVFNVQGSFYTFREVVKPQ